MLVVEAQRILVGTTRSRVSADAGDNKITKKNKIKRKENVLVFMSPSSYEANDVLKILINIFYCYEYYQQT